MLYKYAYKTSNGVRHEGEIHAERRDDVFAQLRAQGIRPIKVVAADGSRENGEVKVRGVRRRVVITASVCAALVAGGVAYFAGRDASPSTTTSLRGRQTETRPAHPLARQEIRGDRNRLFYAQNRTLETDAERYLALFVEPGRSLPEKMPERPTTEDFNAFLAHEVRYASDDYTEVVDLKRILEKIRLEFKQYLADGGTIDAYCNALVKRQNTERETREKASERLDELLKEASGKANADLTPAYDYFLRANAHLQGMGIYQLPLPPILKICQKSVEFDDWTTD